MLGSLAMDTDRDLLERWSAGDRRAGNDLFERHFDSICAFFETKVSGDVEELVQSTFMACVESIDAFERHSSFRTFLFGIARHKLYRYYRTKKRHGDKLDFEMTSVMDLGAGAHTHLDEAEERQMLLAALCTLPLEQQIILELYYWENLDGPELAEVMDISPSTVRSRLHRARQALRDRLAEQSRAPSVATRSIEDLDGWAKRLREQHPG